MKDVSKCKPLVQTARELTAGWLAVCLSGLNPLPQQVSLNTEVLSRISRLCTIPGNTNPRFFSPKGIFFSFLFIMSSLPPVRKPMCTFILVDPSPHYSLHGGWVDPRAPSIDEVGAEWTPAPLLIRWRLGGSQIPQYWRGGGGVDPSPHYSLDGDWVDPRSPSIDEVGAEWTPVPITH
jgi:hypothetical protein